MAETDLLLGLALATAFLLGVVRRSPWWLSLLPGLGLVAAAFLGVGAAPEDPINGDLLPDFGPFLLMVFGGYLLVAAAVGLAIRALIARRSAEGG